MSNVIDKRVVEMRFDNNQFEDKANESLQTLGKLKDALNSDQTFKSVSFDGIAAGIQALQDRFSTWGIVTMRIIENVTDSMIRLVTKGINFVEDAIVSGGLRRAQNIENAHFQLQALLKDEAKVQQYMDDAMDSVDGTAYAYDEAAKAAAQFAASGIEAGEQVSVALRGITGVAAMTNSDYESISRIFTTIAGNGRLMGDQLLQLSSRGMNAAATIAEYFQEVRGQASMTEAAVREMVSDGEISFDTFAAAMNWAFGDQAKRANETFNGAFANMKAAFARIGAGFFSPLIEQNSDLVLLLNSLRVRINDVKAALVFDEQKSAMSGLVSATGMVNDVIQDLFNNISSRGFVTLDELTALSTHGIDTIGDITNYINGVQDGTIRASYATKTAIQEMTGGLEVTSEDIRRFTDEGKISFALFTSAMETAHGNLHTLTYQFTNWALDWAKRISEAIDNADLTAPLQAFDDLIETAKIGFRNLYSLISPLGRAFSQSFSIFDRTEYNVLAATGAIKSFVQSLKPSEKAIESMTELFKGAFDVVAALAKGFIDLPKAIGPTISGPIGEVSNKIADLNVKIGQTLSQFGSWISESGIVTRIYTELSDVIGAVCGWVSTGIGLIGEFIDYIRGMNVVVDGEKTISNIIDLFKGVFDVISVLGKGFGALLKAILPVLGPVDSIAGVLSNLGGEIGRALSSFAQWISQSETIKVIYAELAKVIELVCNWISKGVGLIGQFVDYVKSTQIVKDIIDGISGALDKLGNYFNTVKTNFSPFKSVMDFLKSVADVVGPVIITIFNGIGQALGAIANGFKSISGVGKEGSLSDLLNVGFFAYVISMFDTWIGRISEGLSKVTRIPGAVLSLLFQVKNVLLEFQGAIKADIVQKIAVAVGILAGSMFVLSMIDSDKLASSLGVMSGILLETFEVFKHLSFKDLGKNPLTGLNTYLQSLGTATSIKSIAEAVLMLAGAMYVISKIDQDSLASAFAVISGLLFELGALILVLQNKSLGKLQTGIFPLISLAAAILILASAVKKLSGLSWGEVVKGLAAVGTLMTALALFMRSANKFGKFGINSGLGMVLLAAAIKMLEGPIQDFSKMSLEELAKGLGSLAVGLLSISGAMRLMPQKGALKDGVAIILLAEAVRMLEGPIQDFSKMSLDEIAKGLGTLAGALGAIAVAFRIMPKSGSFSGAVSILIAVEAIKVLESSILTLSGLDWMSITKSLVTLYGALLEIVVAANLMKGATGGAAAMLIMAAALRVLAPAITKLGELSWGEIARGLVALAGSLTVMGVAGVLLKGLTPTILALSAAMMLFGVGVAALGAGLSTLATLSSAAAIAIAGALAIIVTSILDLIITSATKIGEAVVAVIMAICNTIGEAVPTIAETIFSVIAAVLSTVATHIPEIVSTLAQLIVGLFDSLAEHIPEILQSVINFVGKLFGEIKNLLNDAGPDALNNILESLGLLAIVMAAMAGVSKIAGSAMAGLAEAALFVAELGALIAAFGALNQIPGLQWIIGEGGSLLQAIGVAIGNFIGGIAGGIASGFTSQLPQIGNDISNFMTNAQPFIEGAKSIDASMMTGVKTLGESLLYIAGADLVNTIVTKLFGGGIGNFGETIKTFGSAMVDYSNIVSGNIDADAVTASATAGEALAKLNDSIPKTGGWWQDIAGEQDMSDFGLKIVAFGAALVAYNAVISEATLDTDAITASATAGKNLSDLQNSIPKSGGWWQDIAGESDISDFGSKIAAFGAAIVAYSETVSGFSYSEGGPTNSVVTCATELSNLASVVKDTDAGNSLSDFGYDISDFGYYLNTFGTTVASIDIDKIKSVKDVITDFISLVSDSVGIDTSGFDSFSTSLQSLASSGISAFNTAFENAGSQAVIAVSNFLAAAQSAISEEYTTFQDYGEFSADYYAVGFSGETEAAKNAAGIIIDAFITALSHAESKYTTEGETSVKNYIDKFQNQYRTAKTTGETLASNVLTGLAKYARDFSEKGKNAGSSYVAGIGTYKKLAYHAGAALGSNALSGVNVSDSARTYGNNFSIGFINGIKGYGTRAYNAAYSLGRSAVIGLARGIDSNSPSKEAQKSGDYFGIGFTASLLNWIGKAGSAATELGQEAVNALNDAIAKIPSLLSEDINLDPIVRPVIDLSNAQQSISTLNGMFNKSVSVAADVAAVTGTAVNASKVRVAATADEAGQTSRSEDQRMVNQYNTFNITSDNPEEVANRVSYILQKQVERKNALWAR